MKTTTSERTAFAFDQRGIAFVVSLVTMLVLVVLGYGLLVATDGSTRAETSLKAQESAVEVADAGIEYAREKLRACLAGTWATNSFSCNSKQTLTQLLGTAGGGSLVDSTSLSGFPNTTATANGTSNTPFVASDSNTLSPSSFQVFLTNDPGDGVTSGTDGAIGTAGHNRVTLTSFASGPNNIGYAVVQSVVEAPLEGLDGLFQAALILPGPDVTFTQANSANFGIANSSCNATVALTSDTARNTVYSALSGLNGNKFNNYSTSGCSSPSDSYHGVYNFLQTSNPYPALTPSYPPPSNMPLASQNLVTVSWYNNTLLPMLSAVANFRSSSDPGFTLGTDTSPQIVYITGNYTMPSSGNSPPGAGILVVTGNFVMDGNAKYDGLILVVGNGNVTINGGGNGYFHGTMLAANTSTPYSLDSHYVGIPTYNGNGGGTSYWGLSGNAVASIPFTGIASPRRISFVQLR